MPWLRYLKLPLLCAFVAITSVYAMDQLSGFAANAAESNLQAQTDSSGQLDAILAKYYEIYSSIYPFEERIRLATQAEGNKPRQIEIVKSMEAPFVRHSTSSAFPADSSSQVQAEVANSDVIVIGTPIKARSLPIEDHTFAFTQYAIHIEKVVAGDKNSLLPGDTIIVSRGGGELTVDNVLIKAVEPAFSEFLLNQSYVLMLRAIPLTNSYRALGSGTFAVRNGEVTSASALEKGKMPKKDTDRFMSEVETAVSHKRSGRN
jgi:hypothetical protein